jgi:hypothetical protein
MSGQGNPPEGAPEGAPGGGDDEYRSVVFDESFVRAARIQEFSARERLDDSGRPVRIRHVLPRGLARQAVAMLLLLMVAFGFAVYMGVRHPYKAHHPSASEQLRVDVIPLVPEGTVAAVSAAAPFAGSKAAHYRAGAAGIRLPDAHRVGGYAQSEVEEALSTAKEYLTDSSIDQRTVLQGDVGAVRDLLDPGQLDQFDSSLARPDADGSHEATGWLVRFDPTADVRLVPNGIRVAGSFAPAETSDNQLEIISDHTFVYALRGAGAADTGVSLFTVRRELRFHFDHEDLRQHRIEVVGADVAAGPLACSSTVDGYFRPILAGGRAGAVAGSDPYDHGHPVGTVCTPLDTPAPTGGTPTAGGRATPSSGPSSPSGLDGPSGSSSPSGPGIADRPTGPDGAGGAPAEVRTADATPQVPARPLTYPGPPRPSPRTL